MSSGLCSPTVGRPSVRRRTRKRRPFSPIVSSGAQAVLERRAALRLLGVDPLGRVAPVLLGRLDEVPRRPRGRVAPEPPRLRREGDDPESVARPEHRDPLLQRALRLLDPGAAHRAARVEHVHDVLRDGLALLGDEPGREGGEEGPLARARQRRERGERDVVRAPAEPEAHLAHLATHRGLVDHPRPPAPLSFHVHGVARAEHAPQVHAALEPHVHGHALERRAVQAVGAEGVTELDRARFFGEHLLVREADARLLARLEREDARAEEAPARVLEESRIAAAAHDRLVDLARLPRFEHLALDEAVAHRHRELPHRRVGGQREEVGALEHGLRVVEENLLDGDRRRAVVEDGRHAVLLHPHGRERFGPRRLDDDPAGERGRREGKGEDRAHGDLPRAGNKRLPEASACGSAAVVFTAA